MTAPSGSMFFVSIPVADVGRSRAFWAGLGFGFDPRFSGDAAACLIVSELTRVMMLDRETFAAYSHVPVGDPAACALALMSFSVASREDVDKASAAALAAGGRDADPAEDQGFMYTRSFFDLDGHGWQVMWLDPAAAQAGAEAAATA